MKGPAGPGGGSVGLLRVRPAGLETDACGGAAAGPGPVASRGLVSLGRVMEPQPRPLGAVTDWKPLEVMDFP